MSSRLDELVDVAVSAMKELTKHSEDLLPRHLVPLQRVYRDFAVTMSARIQRDKQQMESLRTEEERQ